MDYEKEYKEALERAKAGKPMDEVFPELKESEDERIRKNLVEFLDDVWHLGRDANFDKWGKADCADWLAYLEKQKEHPKEELVYRLNGLMQDYIKEGKDEEEKEHRFKCHQLFWDALEDTNFFEQKEQKPNIELIQRSWYMEGYHDREFSREPKWVIKTGEGGPKYEKNEKYGQPLEQKPVEWSEKDFNIRNNLADYLAGELKLTEKAKLDGANWLKSLRPQQKQDGVH